MLSIIIPVFNSSSTLRQCLESCLSQNYRDVEVIVIDGGSTDGSIAIIEEYSDQLKYWISERDKGIYDAWNKGLKVADGDWICFFGADDCWASDDSLGHLMAKAQFPLVNLVTARLRKLPHKGVAGYEFGARWSAAGMRSHMTIAHVGMPHHRSLFEQFGHFDPAYRIAGDYAFLLRALPVIRAEYVDEVAAIMGGGGVSSTHLRRVRDESYEALRSSPNAGLICALRFLVRFNLRHALKLLRS